MEAAPNDDPLEPSDALCGEQISDLRVCRNGARVEVILQDASGIKFGGYLSPSLAGKLGRELASHAADAFAELRAPRGGR